MVVKEMDDTNLPCHRNISMEIMIVLITCVLLCLYYIIYIIIILYIYIVIAKAECIIITLSKKLMGILLY